MDADEFRRAGHELIDWIATYLGTVDERPVQPPTEPGDVLAQLPPTAPTTTDTFADVIADVDAVVVPALTGWQSPSFFSYFPSNVTYPSILAELLCAGLGVQGMSWSTSPACTEVEIRMLDWMRELLGLPERFANTSDTGGGVIQGSASEATLAAVLSARFRATGGAVNDDGDTASLVAYATDQAHSSIEKGLRIAGIGTDRVRIVPHDEAFAMDPVALDEMITADVANGLVPCIVIATRGTTSTMAFDPLPEIGEVCRRHGVWLHVDAAMAGIAAMAPEHAWVNDGVELADSYCTNPHKWMGINFDCNLYWTADRAALLGALSILPAYLRSSAADHPARRDLRDWQIPLGRRFRSLKLWFSLRLDGADAVREMIRRHVGLTAELATMVAADDRFEIVAPAPLNLLTVAVTAEAAGSPDAADAATDEIIERANASGQASFTRTVLDGRTALRISIGSTGTELSHVVAGWDLVRSCADAVLGPQ